MCTKFLFDGRFDLTSSNMSELRPFCENLTSEELFEKALNHKSHNGKRFALFYGWALTNIEHPKLGSILLSWLHTVNYIRKPIVSKLVEEVLYYTLNRTELTGVKRNLLEAIAANPTSPSHLQRHILGSDHDLVEKLFFNKGVKIDIIINIMQYETLMMHSWLKRVAENLTVASKRIPRGYNKFVMGLTVEERSTHTNFEIVLMPLIRQVSFSYTQTFKYTSSLKKWW